MQRVRWPATVLVPIGTGARRLTSTAPTRDRLVATASRLLRRQGYSGTGVQQILEECGATRSSLYHYFPAGKDALVAEAIESSAAELLDSLEVHRSDTTEASLDRWLRTLEKGLVRSNYADGCPIATAALELAPRGLGGAASCASALDRFVARIAAWLEDDGLKRNTARANAELIVSAIEGALVLAKARRDCGPLSRLRRRIGQLIELNGGALR